jgi:tRNA A37 methylthiotransferase MiaB
MSSGFFIMGFPEDTNETLKNTYDMMNELKLDTVAVFTLIPFVGTALFKQVVKDKLFIDNWNLDELWKNPMQNQQAEFFIKPYNMTVDELYKWRKKFDIMKVKHWKTNPNPATVGNNLSLDSDGIAPRETYRKKNGALINESTEAKPST